ncbi:16S rRNA (uracil(1498)-N(3))-methyltransferase [Chthonobacter rhizosphaerae]|uniref:16S rRNA (uracil(1498)-N(3))-methyltransferase n=1 Tax=Chthonobacter rhizosphaerae TaxID=2735553 RepID=UPI0015EEF6AE|nr:16S rRNA (uracil(1498)-N(3))-methyltransferase [Chthonobacter rhizosphaerae]
MAHSDFRTPRLHVPGPIAEGATVPLEREQANYLLAVLRLADGASVLVFDGASGEFRARVVQTGRKAAELAVEARSRPQPPAPDLLYLFAPLKHARLDYMVQKAVEMGVGRMRPVLTQHTQASRVNLERMQANVVEAAEQCGVLHVPAVEPEEKLDRALARFAVDEPGRRLIFCDEGEETTNPVTTLAALGPGPLAVLIGPEGGFSDAERRTLRALPFVTPIPLGPRILRADTAAVAALAVIQATVGDW